MNSLHILNRYLAALKICSACGLCLSACPVFALTCIETDGPRGRLMLLRALVEGKIAPADITQALARCLLCGKCERKCPSLLPLVRIFFAARFALRALLPVSRRQRFFARLLCSRPMALDFLQPPVRLIAEYLGSKSGLKKRFLPAFRPFSGRRTEKGGAVLLFSGCIARRVFPQIASAAVNVLERNGLTVLAPSGLVCCGRPLAVQGDRKGLLRAVRRNLKILAALDFERLTSPCPGCLHTIREIWPELDGLNGTEREQLNRLQERVIELNVFLTQFMPPQPAEKTKIYWHRPCLLDDAACGSALRMLGLAPGQAEQPVCCGAPLQCLDLKPAGAVGAWTPLGKAGEPSLAARLAERVRSRMAGAECIVTSCPGCMVALGQRVSVPVRHLVEILASRPVRP